MFKPGDGISMACLDITDKIRHTAVSSTLEELDLWSKGSLAGQPTLLVLRFVYVDRIDLKVRFRSVGLVGRDWIGMNAHKDPAHSTGYNTSNGTWNGVGRITPVKFGHLVFDGFVGAEVDARAQSVAG